MAQEKGKVKLYDKGLEEYPLSRVVLNNVMIITIMVLGTIACWYIHAFVALVYLPLAIFGSFILLRKMVCTQCYYYGKRCGMGWGLLSAAMFKKGDIEDFATCTGLKIAPAVYGLMMAIPMILLVISLMQGFTYIKLVILIVLLLLSIYSAGPNRKKGCMDCKMRSHCPGSAYKDDG